jgi:translation initiation factor IF-2
VSPEGEAVPAAAEEQVPEESAVPEAPPMPEPPAPPEPEEAPPPPAPPSPVVPPPPRIGEKVGFIQLPQRPAPRVAITRGVPPRPSAPPPARPLRPGERPPPATRPGRPAARLGERDAGLGAKQAAKFVPPTSGEVITIKPPIIVRDLAEALRKKPFQIIADLMEAGVFATVNQAIEEPVAQRVCAKHGFRFEVEKRERGGGLVHAPQKPVEVDPEDRLEDLRLRAPVVTIMGHVDHGKTTVLDVIRKSNVAAREAGGITQHIGAYTISIPHPERKNELQQITFLDTPGHQAFSSMRARGANVTDIVILVVAANDGVMPQTVEALNHALAAKVPIMVAVNKCDHPNASPLKVRQQLQERGLVCEEWGGNTIFVDVSALTRQGIDRLLELLVFQAEMLELKANPNRTAKGNVIESGLEPGGPTATLLIRKGTLRVGDMLLSGQYWGKVRALVNEEGNRLREAGPSVAVKVLGLNGVPEAGLEFSVFQNEKDARAVAEERASRNRIQDKERRPRMTLENLFDALKSESAKVFKVVVKADTQGSVEAIVEALKKIESAKVSLDVIHSGVGAVTESDVLLAAASKAVVLGFHCRIDSGANEVSKREGVQIKLYSIIYELIDEVKEAMAGLLDPLYKEVVTGSAEVRKVFALSKGGNVAGCVVTSGRIVKGKLRVMRRKALVYEGSSQSLRRFQDEVTEVRAGIECGIRIDGFNDYQVGDAIECYSQERVAQSL